MVRRLARPQALNSTKYRFAMREAWVRKGSVKGPSPERAATARLHRLPTFGDLSSVLFVDRPFGVSTPKRGLCDSLELEKAACRHREAAEG